MKPTLKFLAIMVVAAGLFSSCVSNKKYNELLAEKDQLAQTLSKTQELLKEVEEAKKQLEMDKTSLMGEIDAVKKDLQSTKGRITEVEKKLAEKDAEISRIKGEISSAFANLNKSGLTIRQDGDMFYVSMEEKLLFKSGSATVNKSGKEILGKFADLLKNNADMAVLVEGHTDNKQFVGGGQFSDNWELSVARATNVVKHLVKTGVDASRLTAAGRGEYAPVASNDTPETRQQNRRVEFAVIPMVSKLYDMTKK